MLKTLDYLLMAAGTTVVVAALWRWRRLGGRDPLAGSPIRANRLSPILVWLCVAAHLVGLTAGGGLGRALVPTGMSEKVAEAWTGVVAAAVNQAMVIATCLAVAGLAFRTGLRGFGLTVPRAIGWGRAAGWIGGGWLAGLCCTGLAALAVQWIIRLISSGYVPPDHSVFTTLRSNEATAAMRCLTILGAAVLAPIGEELLFRGVLQTALRRLFLPRRSMYHRWCAILLTASIFGLLHIGTPQFIPALVCFGVLLGFLYERTGSLLVVIAVHMLFNIKSLVWYHLQAWS